MNVKIIPSAEFDRQFKRLAKKYKSLLDDYLSLSKELKKNPLQGSDLGGGVRKEVITGCNGIKGSASAQTFFGLFASLYIFLFAFPPSISDIIDKISPLSYMRVTYQLHAIRN